MTDSIRKMFHDWLNTHDDVTAWSHCGRIGVHGPHVYDTAMNEGPIPNVQCIGTPDLTRPTTPPPTLESM